MTYKSNIDTILYIFFYFGKKNVNFLAKKNKNLLLFFVVEVGQKEKGCKVFHRYQKFKVYRYSTESHLSFLIFFLDNTLYRRVAYINKGKTHAKFVHILFLTFLSIKFIYIYIQLKMSIFPKT